VQENVNPLTSGQDTKIVLQGHKPLVNDQWSHPLDRKVATFPSEADHAMPGGLKSSTFYVPPAT
jgi:hypothetical protein